MAGFRTHVTVSSLLGTGYAGALYSMYGVPLPTATVAGALCGFSGMLPDLDSDTGVPLREAMGFTAAAVPLLLVRRFQSLHFSTDTMILIGIGLYLFVRFGVANMIRKTTVHRGMFHSIPAMLIFGGIAFLLTGASPFHDRLLMSGGVMGGFLSHLILDEIYSVEYRSGRWRTKKSFGTAMKLWGGDRWSNVSTYAKLAIVGMGIVGEPGVMNQFGANQPLSNQVNQALNIIGSLGKNQPQLAKQLGQLQNLINTFSGNSTSAFGPTGAPFPTGPATNQFPPPAQSGATWGQTPTYSATAPQPLSPPAPSAPTNNQQPTNWSWPVTGQSYNNDGQPAPFQKQYDTAQRPPAQYAQ
ncbi:MAG TPA: metal-dependent hydrolase [Lacipirellulaceae bacterium]|nr:metal-dependent hydrolase [Lacipirellulaceae bacterium]